MEEPSNRPVTVAFGQFLREHRMARNLTQKEAAALVGKSPAWYSRVERGQGKVDFELAVALCEAMGENFIKFVGAYKP